MRWLPFTAFLTLILDQASKIGVVQMLELKTRGVIEVIPSLLTFQMAWNRGVNFGLFASHTDATRWFLIALALAISAWVAFWVRRERMGALPQAFAGLLIGGALGNVVDRLVYGAVADFLNVTCCEIHNPWSFNIADIAIFGGAIGLVLFSPSGKTPGKTA